MEKINDKGRNLTHLMIALNSDLSEIKKIKSSRNTHMSGKVLIFYLIYKIGRISTDDMICKGF